MNCFSQLLRLLVVWIWLAATVSSHGAFADQSFSPEIIEPASFVYDGRIEGGAGYDDWLAIAASAYDAGLVLPMAEERTGSVRSAEVNCTPHASILEFIELIAPKTAPNLTFKTGHVTQHRKDLGLPAQKVEAAIAAEVKTATQGASQTGSFWGRVTVDGKVVEYRAFTLPDGTINVGTYYPPTP